VLLDGRVDVLGDLFAGQAANDAAADGADHSSHRPGRHAGRCSGGRPAHCRSNARADRMGTRFIGNGVSVLIAIYISSSRIHKKSPLKIVV
jgi:hypothetical protein